MHDTLVLRAAQFAAHKHRDQRRKDADASPYINHAIAVALTIAEIGHVTDPEVLAAALLHDTLEDTDTTAEELELAFGDKVRQLVEEVTDDGRLPVRERKRRQIDHAPSLPREAVIIKLGDKISNVQDVTSAPPEGWDMIRRAAYLDWAEAVIDNCPSVNRPLERYFREVLAEGRRALTDEPGSHLPPAGGGKRR